MVDKVKWIGVCGGDTHAQALLRSPQSSTEQRDWHSGQREHTCKGPEACSRSERARGAGIEQNERKSDQR